jgi:hypothetical protein
LGGWGKRITLAQGFETSLGHIVRFHFRKLPTPHKLSRGYIICHKEYNTFYREKQSRKMKRNMEAPILWVTVESLA